MVALYGKHESMLNDLKLRFRVSAAGNGAAWRTRTFRGYLHAIYSHCDLRTIYINNSPFSPVLPRSRQSSCISDFYAYFREPWAAAIFYDRFECLRVENRATLLSQAVRDDIAIMFCA